MVNKKENKKYSLEEISILLKISKEKVLDWEKKTLITSQKTNSGVRLFDLGQVRNTMNRLAGKRALKKYKVHVSKPTNYKVIELFAGAGGLALGLANAGFKTELLVEVDKDAVATLRANRPKWKVIDNDIRKVHFHEYKGKVDIVTGGFPCQTFSYAGNGRGFGDTRGTLFFEFARCVEEVQPKIAMAENVRGLMKHDDGKTLNTIISKMEDLGYKTTYKMLRAHFFDVGQKRERLIILGIRKDLDIPFIFPKEKDYVFNLRDVLEGCPDSEGSEYPERKRFIMSKVPEGGYWKDLPVKLAKEYMKGSYFLGGGKTGTARRLSWGEPSLTLVCTPAQGQTERCHPTETRPLRVREYARIQSFPDNWEFKGSMASKYKQIGNAVPVNLAYYVGRCLIAMLEGRFDQKSMLIHPPANKQSDMISELILSGNDDKEFRGHTS